MYIVTLEDHPDGVYSIFDEDDDRVIPIFQEEEDADRYLFMLRETPAYPPMQLVEIDGPAIIEACRDRGHKFSIITPDDFLIPPDDDTDDL